MASIWAVVPAAGRGSRFGGELPKQYLEVAGRPMLAHTLEALLAHPAVAGAVLALALLHGPSWLAAAGVLLWLGVLAWLARGVDRRAAPFSDKS